MLLFVLSSLLLTLVCSMEYDAKGTHCKGATLSKLDTTEKSECVKRCDEDRECIGYLWNKQTNKMCLTKSRDCERTGWHSVWELHEKSIGLDKGSCFAFRDTFEHCAGDAISQLFFEGKAKCEEVCRADVYCSGIVVNKKDGSCLAKGPNCRRRQHDVWEFYSREIVTCGQEKVERAPTVIDYVETDYHCGGGAITPEYYNLQDCKSFCSSDKSCIGVTGNKEGTLCWGKSKECEHKYNDKWRFYEKKSLQVPNQRSAARESEYEGFADTGYHCQRGQLQDARINPAECALECLGNERCDGFSLNKGGAPYTCILKTLECENTGENPQWTYLQKTARIPSAAAVPQGAPEVPTAGGGQFEAVTEQVACINYLKSKAAPTVEICTKHCQNVGMSCRGISFRQGECKLIRSFDCSNEYVIYKKETLQLEEQRNETIATLEAPAPGMSTQ